jgi:hypothetical protein
MYDQSILVINPWVAPAIHTFEYVLAEVVQWIDVVEVSHPSSLDP